MNKVILIGRIPKDIESKLTTNQKQYCMFSLAVQREFKNPDGEYDSDFINCKAFGNTAELLSNYCRKGDRISVEGRIQNNNYEKDGKKIYSTEIIVEKIGFLEPKKTTAKQETQKQQEVVEDPFKDFADEIEISDDDLPF